ncbi:MAG TPA: tripartite tricarboxylate transporter TctB family protein [Casimicrobiaceae bacterium]|nr:tripartite tricarboxylate transporter TctB family protein [Casimicrobiaceae bacterium]
MDEARGNGDDGRSVVSTRTMEAVVAALLFAFGATFLYQSYELGFQWAVEGPQSGFFPFYVSLIICLSSLVVFVNALRGKAGRTDEAFVERGQLRQVLAVLIPAAIYVLGVQLIGIYVASVVYIGLFMRFLGHYSWLKSLLIAVIITVVFFFMFEIWFQVPLYKGIWDATSWTGY